MVKAGKHTLALASRYSPLSASTPRRTELRRSMSYTTSEKCRKNEQTLTADTPPALKAIRAEFCRKYKNRIQENCEARNEDANAESQELRTLYRKLREVVPSLSQSPKEPVTSLDVVLSAIDYIRDLHSMLGDKFPSTQISTVTSQSYPGQIPSSQRERVPLTQLENKRPELHKEVENDEANLSTTTTTQ